jgi:hypothetical protein
MNFVGFFLRLNIERIEADACALWHGRRPQDIVLHRIHSRCDQQPLAFVQEYAEGINSCSRSSERNTFSALSTISSKFATSFYSGPARAVRPTVSS